MKNHWLLLSSSLLAFGLTACPTPTITTPTTPTPDPQAPQGALSLSITAPTDITPNVLVSGPNGYSKTVIASGTLSNLAVGSYTVSALAYRKAGAVVDELFDGSVTGGNVTVSDAATATSTVTYSATKRGGTGMVWVPTAGMGPGVVQGFVASSLTASGALTAPLNVFLELPNAPSFSTRAQTAVFDAVGNLWVADSGNGVSFSGIRMYDSAQLTGPDSVSSFKVLLASQGIGQPKGMAFDASGNLWGINSNNNTIFKLTPTQLAVSDQPLPSVVISNTTFDGIASISGASDLAFDAAGNLWVTNFSSVVKFSAADLSATGTPTPAIQIKSYSADGGNNLFGANGLAFDSSGNLWVTNAVSASGRNRVSKYNVSALPAGSSTPAPAAMLNMVADASPINIAFDNAGALWVYTVNDSINASRAMVKFSNPASFVGTSTPTADLTLTGLSKGRTGRFTFNPVPKTLPLYQQK